MRTAVCTGSFDPPTLGHMDIFMRAAELFDMVYVAVLTNPNKKPVFTADERCGLLMEAARAEGLNNVCAEASMEGANKFLRPDIETVYLLARPELEFISSSAVKEMASYGKDIDGLVPDAIKNKIAERLIKR